MSEGLPPEPPFATPDSIELPPDEVRLPDVSPEERSVNVYQPGTVEIYEIGGKEYVDREDYEALRAKAAADRYRATHDRKTGALNLLGLEEKFEELDGAGIDAIVLYVDIDNLKAINDNLSTAEGDEAIVGTHEALKLCLRDDDAVARIGGDEFFVVITEDYREDRDRQPIDIQRLMGITQVRLSAALQRFKEDHPRLVQEGFDIELGYALRRPRMSIDEVKALAEAMMKKQKIDKLHYSPEQSQAIADMEQTAHRHGIALRDLSKLWRGKR